MVKLVAAERALLTSCHLRLVPAEFVGLRAKPVAQLIKVGSAQAFGGVKPQSSTGLLPIFS